MGDDQGSDSRLSFAEFGVGGLVACCVVLELLGGAALLGGVAAVIGLSTGLTYLLVIGLAGALTALLALGYSQYRTASYG